MSLVQLNFKLAHQAYKLKIDQLVICKCEGWNEEGYQAARWNGSEFQYESQPNLLFDQYVTEFAIIDENISS